MAPQEIPEWKKHVIGGKKSSFGKKTDMTLIQQRQSLPIFKLRDDLIKVIYISQHMNFRKNFISTLKTTFFLNHFISFKGGQRQSNFNCHW